MLLHNMPTNHTITRAHMRRLGGGTERAIREVNFVAPKVKEIETKMPGNRMNRTHDHPVYINYFHAPPP